MTEHDPTKLAEFRGKSFTQHRTETADGWMLQTSAYLPSDADYQAMNRIAETFHDTWLYMAHLVDSAREAGRREVYAEIAKLDPRSDAGDGGGCNFCGSFQTLDTTPPDILHAADCLFARARAAVTEGQ